MRMAMAIFMNGDFHPEFPPLQGTLTTFAGLSFVIADSGESRVR
jgi:hypothetical protein